MVPPLAWAAVAGWLFLLASFPFVQGAHAANKHFRFGPQGYLDDLHPSFTLSSGVGDTGPIELCECEEATGNNGLSCDKEGWFISGVQRVGVMVDAIGQPHVPLNPAICCRPCVPKALPTRTGMSGDASRVLGIISVACHETKGSGGPQMCDGPGSVVAGWYSSVQTKSNTDVTAWYPEGPVKCCTPSLLLEGGEVWNFRRCDCVSLADDNRNASCGAMSTHMLLQGYRNFVVRPEGGDLVPTMPVECCRACLSPQPDSCELLDDCSGNGECNRGSCSCNKGYSGPMCSKKESNLIKWLLALVFVCCCLAFMAVASITGRVVHFFRNRTSGEAESENGEQLQEALILRVDDDNGSVGSEDTTDCDSDGDGEALPPVLGAAEATPAVPVDVGGTVHNGEERGAGGRRARDPGEVWPSPGVRGAEWATGVALEVDTSGGRRISMEPFSPIITTPRLSGSEIEAAGAAPDEPTPPQGAEYGSPHTAADHEAPGGPGDGASGGEGDDAEVWNPEESDLEDGCKSPKGGKGPDGDVRDDTGMHGVSCSVCMNRPVQVVVIPCGHACMCRRCSRRLARCPICRKAILRRQRLFIGG